ncbi:MAG TPA: ribonuclease Z [Candidatus Altiarchaeales archaeon]|nr:ribonuclease Z [Candidatus Altiarchaeales archaeon]
MELIFLGTAGCIPTEERNLSALVIEFLNEPFLFDCGEGTQRQMRKCGVNFMRIDHIFITHLHADHFLGLGGMIQSMDFMERNRDLNIYGPAGMQDAMDKLLGAGTFNLEAFDINVHEVGEGVVLDTQRYSVHAMKVLHTKNSLAYSFQEASHRQFQKQTALDLGVPEGRLFSKLQDGQPVEINGKTITPDMVLGEPMPGRKIVYSGDTKYMPEMADFSKNADILVHEATYSIEEAEKLAESFHTTTLQAAEVAKTAGVKKLYLTHLSQRYTEPEKLAEEARTIFPESYVAEDFMRVKIEKHW